MSDANACGKGDMEGLEFEHVSQRDMEVRRILPVNYDRINVNW
jgi:hypothetical protein